MVARRRKIKRALILLAADNGMSDADIAASVGVGTSTVYRVKRAFVEECLEKALEEEPRAGGVRKLSGHEEVLLLRRLARCRPWVILVGRWNFWRVKWCV